MADTTITSANGVLTLAAASVFPVPVRIEGFATDKSWAVDAIDLAEVMMGVDGKMSAGFVPKETKMTISLQADSASKTVFSAIIAAMKTAREILYLSGTLSLPSTGEVWTFTRGVLTNGKQAPDGAKVLQPQDFVITWESVNRSLL